MKKLRLDPAVLGRLQHLRHDLGEELGAPEQHTIVGGACTYCDIGCTATCRDTCDFSCNDSCREYCMSNEMVVHP